MVDHIVVIVHKDDKEMFVSVYTKSGYDKAFHVYARYWNDIQGMITLLNPEQVSILAR